MKPQDIKTPPFPMRGKGLEENDETLKLFVSNKFSLY